MVDERPADAPDLPDPLEDDTSLRAELGANAPSRTIALAWDDQGEGVPSP